MERRTAGRWSGARASRRHSGGRRPASAPCRPLPALRARSARPTTGPDRKDPAAHGGAEAEQDDGSDQPSDSIGGTDTEGHGTERLLHYCVLWACRSIAESRRNIRQRDGSFLLIELIELIELIAASQWCLVLNQENVLQRHEGFFWRGGEMD